MDPTNLIPSPDTIPAPSLFFQILEILTFTLHILVINAMLGGIFITLYQRFFQNENSIEDSLHGSITKKIPVTFALGINLGVAPLLFVQVIYGNYFYTSSVLMGTYWILIIPLLILAYYGAYIHARKYSKSESLAKVSLLISGLIVLYIGFMLVNNLTMMTQPENWTGYFNERTGTLLNTSDATLIPRYLHFIAASVAVGGLFLAIVWNFRKKKDPEKAEAKVVHGLKIFSFATMIQIIIGFWFLLAIPSDFISEFMGGNIFYTILLFGGIITGIASIMVSINGKLNLTLVAFLLTIVFMVLTRDNLRALYMKDHFSFDQLTLNPQYGVMTLFLLIFVIGLGSVYYMIKLGFQNKEGGQV